MDEETPRCLPLALQWQEHRVCRGNASYPPMVSEVTHNWLPRNKGAFGVNSSSYSVLSFIGIQQEQ
eukprot:6204920-Amphidinium_carterae.1